VPRQPRSCRQAARCLRLSPRTLAYWNQRQQQGQLIPRDRGRPCVEFSVDECVSVHAVFQEAGPRLGLPTLQEQFPELRRCVLADLQSDYRFAYQDAHRQVVEELTWTTPGAVWAIDHTQPPQPVDGVYRQILAVRELASGMQLAWTPVLDATAEEAALVLATLFTEHGAPLVLKSDNGSAFISQKFHELLDAWHVTPLFSPPRTPRYNGACEAGIGAGKSRTAYQAARHGRYGDWTSDDLEAARCWANEYHYPHGLAAGTPAARFAARPLIDPALRAAFHATLDCNQHQLQHDHSLSGLDLTDVLRALLTRRAIRCALVEHRLLLTHRRSIPLLIRP
jgi:transposase InsO family protein